MPLGVYDCTDFSGHLEGIALTILKYDHLADSAELSDFKRTWTGVQNAASMMKGVVPFLC